jgi:hypothetical protein
MPLNGTFGPAPRFSITGEHVERSEKNRHGSPSAGRFGTAPYTQSNKKSKIREEDETWLAAQQPVSTRCCRAVGKDVDGSARRETGRGQRHVVGENARENVPLFRARKTNRITPLD